MARRIFISYSHKDRAYVDELKNAVSPFLAGQDYEFWDDSLVQAGERWQTVTSDAALSSVGAIMLVSANYLASERFSLAEGLYLAAEQERRGLRILWLLVGECDWNSIPFFRDHLAAYPVGKPLDQMTLTERARVWEALAQEIKRMLNESTNSESAPSSSSAGTPPEQGEMRAAHVTDQPAERDTLGFRPYVEAVAHFLMQPQTEPPLTLSVEGEWGSGKSSFMLQVEKLLKAQGALTVQFNAWRHDKEDALWAAFALEFLREIRGSWRTCRYWGGKVNLLRRRFNWDDGYWDFLKAIGLYAIAGLFFFVALVHIFGKADSWASDLVSAVNESHASDKWEFLLEWIFIKGSAGAASLLLAAKTLVKMFGNPLEVNLKKHVESPDYDKRIAFVEQFHEDFRKIVEAYAGGKKVFVFIDDVDRCDVPKAADLMQALNLLISNDPRLIFIIGMDREKVAAGIAVKHEKLLPYLASSTDPAQGIDRTRALEYGYAFIEKFVQVPFLVPQPRDADLDAFLANVAAAAPPSAAANATPWLRKLLDRFRGYQPPAIPPNHIVPGGETPEALEHATQRYSEALRLTFGDQESDNVRSIAKMVAPLFDYNPRRLKQFINVFRLQAYIGNSVGLFGNYGDEPGLIKLDQLGKFVALSLRYPLLRAELEEDHTLLRQMQNRALNLVKDPPQRVEYWLAHPGVSALLKHGCVDATENALPADQRVGCLALLNVEKLLRVCPIVLAPQSASPPPPQEEPEEPAEEPFQGSTYAEDGIPPWIKRRAATRVKRAAVKSGSSTQTAATPAAKRAPQKKPAVKK